MKGYAQEFVAHVLAPKDGGFAPVAWSPAPVTVRAVDDRDAIRADYEAHVELQEAETVLSPLTDGARVGWLLAFGAAPPADAADIDALAAGRELRIVQAPADDAAAALVVGREDAEHRAEDAHGEKHSAHQFQHVHSTGKGPPT